MFRRPDKQATFRTAGETNNSTASWTKETDDATRTRQVTWSTWEAITGLLLRISDIPGAEKSGSQIGKGADAVSERALDARTKLAIPQNQWHRSHRSKKDTSSWKKRLVKKQAAASPEEATDEELTETPHESVPEAAAATSRVTLHQRLKKATS